ENDMFSHLAGLGQPEADALVKASVDAGVNFCDTANVYSAGTSEEILGQAVKNLGLTRDEIVLATKALGRMHPGPNGAGAWRG
ncbi:aldo/keto reductase, partial [Mycobacterium tuberculosis]|nr:aldo/keto reductase [Mycobacterium tuberculosis]